MFLKKKTKYNTIHYEKSISSRDQNLKKVATTFRNTCQAYLND